MRTTIPAQPQTTQSPKARIALPFRELTLFAAIFGLAILFATAQQPSAQAPATQTATTPAHKPVHSNRRISAAHQPAPSAQVAPTPVTPPAPKPPDWPANDHPAEATVVWNSQGLQIEASNSSLEQILKDVATATGAKVEGLGADERVFGSYGPGKARDVLSQSCSMAPATTCL